MVCNRTERLSLLQRKALSLSITKRRRIKTIIALSKLNSSRTTINEAANYYRFMKNMEIRISSMRCSQKSSCPQRLMKPKRSALVLKFVSTLARRKRKLRKRWTNSSEIVTKGSLRKCLVIYESQAPFGFIFSILQL